MTGAPLGCYCSYYTGTKSIKYSVNIALVFFQVAFFLLFSVLSFSEWSLLFLLFIYSIVYDKVFLEGFEIGKLKFHIGLVITFKNMQLSKRISSSSLFTP